MNQSDEQKPTNTENTEELSANGHFVEDKSSMRYLEAPEVSLDGGLTIIARKWKQNEPKEPLNIIDTRTFAERVEEALTIEAFRAWLESKDGDEIVGVACEASGCPIHEFLEPHLCKQIKGYGARLEVSEEVVLLAKQKRIGGAPLPEWADRYVARVDAEPGCYPSITAEEALAILSEVEKELADTSEKGEG